MTEETAHKLEVEAPDAGEFDLGAWIDGHHAYPTYVTTVHLDKDAVVQANKLLAEIEKLEKDLASLQEIVENSSATGSLGEESDVTKRHREVGKQVKAKKSEREGVLAKAKSSALKVVFQKGGKDGEGDVFAGVRKALTEEFPHLAADFTSTDRDRAQRVFQDNSDLTHRQNVLLFHATIASITNAKGQVVQRGEKLGEAVISNLIRRLDGSDLSRLQINANQSLMGADLAEEQIDAGFLS